MKGGSFYRTALISCAVAVLAVFENHGLAGDPLDEYDPTSEWEQQDVVPAPRHPAEDQELEKRLREEWLRLRENWPVKRRMFLLERAEHKQQAKKFSKGSAAPLTRHGEGPASAGRMQSPAVQGDKQVPEADKVRGDETLPLENPPTPAPRNAEGTPAAAGEAAGGDSAKQRLQEGESPHQAKKADAGDEQGLSEEEILRQVEERQRKEQQELEKKTGLVEGEDGQFVDPELQEEMKKDE